MKKTLLKINKNATYQDYLGVYRATTEVLYSEKEEADEYYVDYELRKDVSDADIANDESCACDWDKCSEILSSVFKPVKIIMCNGDYALIEEED